MRIKVILNYYDKIKLPMSYNYILQSMIYNNLPDDFAEFLHENGFKYEKRNFKLFTFSKILGKYEIIRENNSKYFLFTPPIFFQISSPIEDIILKFSETIVKKKYIILANQHIDIDGIEVLFMPKIKSFHIIKVLSPIVVYSTLISSDRIKKTYYYNPFEKQFSELIKKNLLKKYKATYDKELSENINFKIMPEKVNKRNEQIIIYKKFVIKGWSGIYRLVGDERLISIAYDAGLGSKNSLGFGMFDLIK